jgi:hypothetical protein
MLLIILCYLLTFYIIFIGILFFTTNNNKNEKFGAFSIGGALKTPIIYDNRNVQYPGVS